MFNYSILIVLCCAEFIYSAPSAKFCVTPNNEQGRCVSILSCKPLQESLIYPDKSIKAFVLASKCEGNFTVCCGTSSNWKNTEVENNHKKPSDLELDKALHELRKEYVLKNLLPPLSYCGLQHSDDHNNLGNNTALDEFPWLVHIPYTPEFSRLVPDQDIKCAGVLISNIFVLTARHCPWNTYLLDVKIGQYNKLQNIVCVTNPEFKECTDSVIAAQVRARDMIPNTNLMLIKLNKKIDYSDYVRPICLSLNKLHRAKVGQTVLTTGWGEDDEKGSTIRIKKKIIHHVVDSSICNEDGKDKNVCLLTNTTNNYICAGDEGGPLMYSYKHQWFLEGIIYFPHQIERCAKETTIVSERITAKAMEGIIDYMYYLTVIQLI